MKKEIEQILKKELPGWKILPSFLIPETSEPFNIKICKKTSEFLLIMDVSFDPVEKNISRRINND